MNERNADTVPMWRDFEHCYRAASSRDRRFDGWFYTAVRSTGIYCRPSCPAITPKRANVEFHPTAAAAQRLGFRACKRCRPDASPGSPEWDVRADVVARAVRLIADGVVDRDGVTGLAARLGYSSRHLTRLLTDAVGAGPLALAREQRARTARLLLETTSMPVTDIAFASGFASVRQFNDTVRDVYASSPRDLRTARRAAEPIDGPAPWSASAMTVRLAVRQPFAGPALLGFLGERAVPGVEHWDGERLTRSLSLPRGHGVVSARFDDGAIAAGFRLQDWRDLAPAVRRVRRWLDLDADPVAVDAVLGHDGLGHDALLADAVRRTPGRRVPGSVDPTETAFRAVVGQQISVAGARTLLGRIVTAAGDRVAVTDPDVSHVFPSPATLVALDPAQLPMPAARRRTVVEVAGALVDGRVVLDAGVDRAAATTALLAIPGIGPWTADYVRMRGLGDPDVWLGTDLGVLRALDGVRTASVADAWRPWRSYALHHVWAMTPPAQRSRPSRPSRPGRTP